MATSPARLYVSELSVRNFGPVKSADIRLGDVTFIVGPQNTGKTYLSTLVALLSNNVMPFVTSGFLTRLSQYYRESKTSGVVSYKDILESPDREKIDRFVREAVLISPGLIDNVLKQNFLVERVGELVRSGETKAEIKAKIRINSDDLCVLGIQFAGEAITVSLDIPDGGVLKLIAHVQPEMMFMGNTRLSIQYGGGIKTGALYIPAERFMIVPIFGQVINLVLNIYRGLQPGPPSLGQFNMKQTLFDYLSNLNNALSKTSSYKVLDVGNVIVSNRQIQFDDSLHKARFPIFSVGSGLAQLVGIVIPAEALNPDFLIIEEPEVNLHPDAQLKVAEYLGSLSKSKRIRILLTTHSHYLIAKLALMQAKGEIQDLFGYSIDVDGIVERLPVDKTTGSVDLPKGIEHALESLAGEAMRLTGES